MNTRLTICLLTLTLWGCGPVRVEKRTLTDASVSKDLAAGGTLALVFSPLNPTNREMKHDAVYLSHDPNGYMIAGVAGDTSLIDKQRALSPVDSHFVGKTARERINLGASRWLIDDDAINYSFNNVDAAKTHSETIDLKDSGIRTGDDLKILGLGHDWLMLLDRFDNLLLLTFSDELRSQIFRLKLTQTPLVAGRGTNGFWMWDGAQLLGFDPASAGQPLSTLGRMTVEGFPKDELKSLGLVLDHGADQLTLSEPAVAITGEGLYEAAAASAGESGASDWQNLALKSAVQKHCLRCHAAFESEAGFLAKKDKSIDYLERDAMPPASDRGTFGNSDRDSILEALKGL